MAKAGALGRLAARAAGVPIVVHTYHGFVLEGYYEKWKSRMLVSAERFLARRTDRLVALSPALGRMITDVYNIAPAAKVAVVPPAVDTARLEDADSRKGRFKNALGLPPGVRLIAFAGRLVSVKNPGLFVEAAARCLSMKEPGRDDLRFVVLGDGSLSGALANQIQKLHLSGQVLLPGAWTGDMREVYADLDALVFTSRNEGVPIAMLEALACGVPVVSTAVGGIPDVISDARLGRLVPKATPDALVEAILAVLAAPEADSAFQKEFVRARFSAARAAEAHEALYQYLLRFPRGGFTAYRPSPGGDFPPPSA
jgi:glycosyltransferase involved in cell wall biosynthesis